MDKIYKRKTKKVKEKENKYRTEDIFPLRDESREIEGEEEADHVIDGYSIHKNNHYEYFNDDLGIDQDDYEVEQEKYAVQSEDLQPLAVDRYFKRIGKSRRTPR
jgi:hypothetical protein